MTWPEPVTLRGHFAILEPLSRSHCDALADATRDGELWKLWYTKVPMPEEMMAEIDRRLDRQTVGSMIPFAVLDAMGTAVGMTTYMNIDARNKRLEIGSTWYAERVQRSALNTECKMMLMTHAFETLDCHCSRVPDLIFQPEQSSGDRTAGRQAGWHPAQSSTPRRRNIA